MHNIDHALLAMFSDHSRQAHYETGDMVIRAGDMPSGVYLITNGWVKVYCLSGDGEPNIMMSLGAGDIFPLMWAISGRLRDVSFKAMEHTTTLRISRERFVQGLRNDPKVAEALLSKLADYLWGMCDELENLSYRSARERVAFRLLSLAERFGQSQPQTGKTALSLKVPNEYIARSSNMTRETTSREISWLAKKNVIEHQGSHIIIHDLSELKRLSGKNT